MYKPETRHEQTNNKKVTAKTRSKVPECLFRYSIKAFNISINMIKRTNKLLTPYTYIQQIQTEHEHKSNC